MNCKQGDLARVVRSLTNPANEGKIVRCIRMEMRRGAVTGERKPAWIVDPDITVCGAIGDHCLRPLRNSNGEDEMLRIAGRPRELVSG